jgi:hypothetical protein
MNLPTNPLFLCVIIFALDGTPSIQIYNNSNLSVIQQLFNIYMI